MTGTWSHEEMGLTGTFEGVRSPTSQVYCLCGYVIEHIPPTFPRIADGREPDAW